MNRTEMRMNMKNKFSIIVTSLNPGNKIEKTIKSILAQTEKNYEIIIKDGGSTDNSLVFLDEAWGIRVCISKDTGIYDGMNQAVELAEGDFLLFLNCGDTFFDERVLERTLKFIKRNPLEKLVYGDTFCEKTDSMVAAPPFINGFTCYRNIPCHQSCFYHNSLFENKRYNSEYRIRADYDHFLHCVYKSKTNPKYMGFPVASYEGGGYSETKENRKRDKEEHKRITKQYMSSLERGKYRLLLLLSLAPLRKAMAESKIFSGFYEGLKRKIYEQRK